MQEPLLNQNINQPYQVQATNDIEQENHKCSTFKVKKDQAKWLTEAYDDFKDRLCFDYLITADVNTDFSQLIKEFDMIPGNSSAQRVDCLKAFACLGAIFICPLVYYSSRAIFEVNNNSFAFVTVRDSDGAKTVIYGPGQHVLSNYHSLEGVYSFQDRVPNNIIDSKIGDLKIAIVDQGTIMHLTYGGQNIILGPGMHKIRDPVKFHKIVSLDSFYIEIGPEKWVTIPDGYDGISVNRGKIQILKGGKQHHLPHVGDKFVKMVPLTLQTDKVPTDIATYVKRIEAGKDMVHSNQIDPAEHLTTTTAEGATITIDAMIFWKILDTELASKTAMEILKISDNNGDDSHLRNQNTAIQAAGKNISVLRLTVLRIAKNHLSTMVGTCSIAGKTGLQSEFNKAQLDDDSNQDLYLEKNEIQATKSKIQSSGSTFDILQYLQNSTTTLTDLINTELNKIGCQLDNICIYSVIPSREIQHELDKQTKAKVDANTAVIAALSKQQAQKIDQQLKLDIKLQDAENEMKVNKMNQEQENILAIEKAQNEMRVNKMNIDQENEMNIQRAENEIKVQKIKQDQKNMLDVEKAQNETKVQKIKQEQENDLKLQRANNDLEVKKLKQEQENQLEKEKAQNDIQVRNIVQENENKLQLEKLKIDNEIIDQQSQAQAKAKLNNAGAESQAIVKIAQARQEEADKLQGNNVAKEMAMIRVAGETGEKIFQGKSNKFVFGKNPGDVLYSMVDQFQRKSL